MAKAAKVTYMLEMEVGDDEDWNISQAYRKAFEGKIASIPTTFRRPWAYSFVPAKGDELHFNNVMDSWTVEKRDIMEVGKRIVVWIHARPPADFEMTEANIQQFARDDFTTDDGVPIKALLRTAKISR